MLPLKRDARPMWIHRLGLAMAFLFLATVTGCMVGPDFQKPDVQVPAGWTGPRPAPAPQSATPAEMDLARWWTVFNDPTLTSLVKTAIESNLDLKLAEARIRQARAARGVAAGGLGPTLNASGSYSRSQTPGASVGAGGVTRSTSTNNQFQVGFDAGWEVDIFGGVRRGVEAAEADLQASLESRRDVLVTLTAEVASNYLDLRAFQQRIAVARQNLKAQAHSAELTRLRFEAGFVSGLDVANAQAQVATTSSQIPLLEASIQQTIYRISVLLGREPAALIQELSPVKDIPAAPPSVPLGLPSDLLRRRPDIRMAETDIRAATARIGVATADLFPKFNLLGSGSYQSSNTGSLFNPLSLFWSFGPSVSWNLFDTGRTRANIEVQKALQEQTVITYRQTVLTALEEVENALIASAKEQEHRAALVKAVTANQKAVELATRLYTDGQTDFLSVLQSQQALYASQDALVQSNGTISTNLIALYKALGGGWDDQAEAKPAP